MNYSFLSIKKFKQPLSNIVLAEGDDSRVIEAAVAASRDKIANCILIGKRDSIEAQAAGAGWGLDNIRIETPQTSQHTARYTENLLSLRAHKGMTEVEAQQLVLDPLYFADLMLQAGDADGSIAGARYTTGDRVRTAFQIIGVAPGFDTVSSAMLMVFDAEHHQRKHSMIFSDCALVVTQPQSNSPKSPQLQSILQKDCLMRSLELPCCHFLLLAALTTKWLIKFAKPLKCSNPQCPTLPSTAKFNSMPPLFRRFQRAKCLVQEFTVTPMF